MFAHGRSPQTPCTCANGVDHGKASEKEGCDLGIKKHAGGGQPCLWWSQVSSYYLFLHQLLLAVYTIFLGSLNVTVSVGNLVSFFTTTFIRKGCSIHCDKCATEPDADGKIPTAALKGNAPHADKLGFRKSYCNQTLSTPWTLPRWAWTMNLHAVEGAVNDSYRCIHVSHPVFWVDRCWFL